MASRANKADSVWEFTHNNAYSFMHVNHFLFHPIKAVLLYGIIADQSNRSLLELHAKPGASAYGTTKTLGVPVWISRFVTLALLHDCELYEEPWAFPSFATRCLTLSKYLI